MTNTTQDKTTNNTVKYYPCPRCKTPAVWQDNPAKPFCSERCKLIDLGAWANEDYRLPTNDSSFSEEL